MSTPTPVNKLKAAMQGMAGVQHTSAPVPAPVEAASQPSVKAPRPPSRQGKRVISAYIEPAAAKQLRLLAVDEETSAQALLEEALNDLFRKYNRSAVA